MPDPLILCVPNFSEGRRPGTVTAIARAVRLVRGAMLLDQHLDPDHHRAVLTFAGSPEAVLEAAFRAVAVAARLIDLRTHRGEHPRIGATDVVPFVPLSGASLSRCASLARKLGRRIGRELDIPVFLYERASSRPERRRLEQIRQGGLAGLAERMARHPAWGPDFGPARMHPTAGATVVGARPPLIAFNVNLASRDLSLARTIARTIRSSNGGLPHVKAIGIELKRKGMVQVSTNLTDYRITSPLRVLQAVQREAERRRVRVGNSEVIGLIPAEAMIRSAAEVLQIEGFEPDRVLELRFTRRAGQSHRGGRLTRPASELSRKPALRRRQGSSGR